jgi:hypothetical protein
MHHIDLAWSLAGAAGDHLSDVERCTVYVALGAGDTGAAIGHLARAAADHRIFLCAEVAAALDAWWAARSRSDSGLNASASLPDNGTPATEPVATNAAARLAATRSYRRPNRIR